MKCLITGKQADYKIGIAEHDQKTVTRMVGAVCSDKTEQALTNVMDYCFGSNFWPIVFDLDGKLIYHSYDADKEKLSCVEGWKKLTNKNSVGGMMRAKYNTHIITSDANDVFVTCPKCEICEQQPIDQQRHHLQSFSILSWEKENEPFEISNMQCISCGWKFTLIWNYKNK